MAFLGVLITGFLVGLVARALKPGNDRMGILLTTLLGIAGALFAGYVGQAFNLYAVGEPVGFFAAVLGAIVVLLVAHAAFGRRSRLW